MVKKLLFILLIVNISYAKDIYEINCVKCHKKLPVSIDKYFYRYLLKYSGEKAVKTSMFEYLKNPSKDKTIMPEAFINRFGVKKRSKLKDDKLKDAIDIYWEKYKVFGKLK
ncbi:hypothetical protein GCM10012288_19560 [Malaciobacter pacificus]|uniref:Uncharacterized protein n=1 Tax=Malaciobacter pacificus TaxID=1080223 RepID=A0A5C2H877_9BACT|nr:hypothetical protein [Malaciobacter pacificus]QEP34418.1 hypothetical protein APAC_1301 [Malaciobacter pacificus]GGD45295.1 hypothetical protein GCM10012288_19560 [Malaciobacter pacificus]